MNSEALRVGAWWSDLGVVAEVREIDGAREYRIYNIDTADLMWVGCDDTIHCEGVDNEQSENGAIG